MRSKLFLLFFLFPLASSGQTVPASSAYDISTIDMLSPSPHLFQEKSARAYGTNGSPYVFEDFRIGNIFYANQMRVDGKLLNYDCHNNQLVYSDGKAAYLLDSRNIDYIQIILGEQRSKVFEQVFLEDLKQRVFVEVLYNEKSVLYKRYFKDFQKADYGGAYSQDRRYDEYHDRHSYYIKTADSDLQLMKPKKKSVLEVMDTDGNELEKYIKQEKINLKSDEGLVQLIRYYDSL